MGRLSPRGSKAKGDKYERELAEYFNEALYGGEPKIFRAPLSGGGRSTFGGGSADLTGTPFVWVEAKRTEKFAPYAAMEQAERGIAGKKSRDVPVVVSRRNQMTTSDSLVVMRMKDWIDMYHSYLDMKGELSKDDTEETPTIYSEYEEI
jgi:Holliday junction resolvase